MNFVRHLWHIIFLNNKQRELFSRISLKTFYKIIYENFRHFRHFPSSSFTLLVTPISFTKFWTRFYQYSEMLSKLIQPCRFHSARLLALRTPQKLRVRSMWGIPPSQYDMAYPDKFKPGYAMRVYWELIPVFVTTGISFAILFFSIFWACTNKVCFTYMVLPV